MQKQPIAPPEKPAPKAGMASLRNAEAWVFDLDNTLYPATVDLFSQIDVRMRDYIAGFLGVDADQAYLLQKKYFRDYGTSLRGLMRQHGMDPGPFLDHVHDIDVNVLAASPALEAVLARLPGRKLVFTNASVDHAERVMDRLGIAHHFDAVFDIIEAQYIPKPEPEIYPILVERHGLDPARTVMVEDIARNLAPAAALGMTTVWVRTVSEHGADGAEEDYVHHVVDDLVAWLEDVLGGRV
jgi:putative hydrolase of the HAD superfamily